LKAHLKYSAKNLLSSVYVHEIVLLIIKVSNYFLYRIFNRYIKQQINKYQYKTNDQNYFHNKIIYLIPSLGVGGAERQLINLINYLSKPLTLKKHEEFEILLVCFNHKTLLNDFYLSQLANNIRIIDLSEGVGFKLLIKELRKNKKYFWLGKNLIHYNRLEELVALEKPQILHAWLDTPSICGAIAGISNKVPNIILSTRSLNPSNFLSNRFYRKSVYQALSNYKQITFLNNSNAGAISYEKWLGLKKGYVKVIYNGFEIESLRTLHSNLIQKSKSSKIIIGGVMRFNYEKNLDLWIKVAKNLSEKSDLVNFVIIGDGPELSRVRRLIKKLELTKLVELVKPTNNIYSHMSKFDVLLLTSRIEGLPNVLIEAQLLGIPVVSTNCGGAIETFIDSTSGILVGNYNPKLIADTLFLLVSDREGLSRYSVNATKQAAQRFNIDTIAQQYVNIYNKI
jgi:glycosyltransferase involved in cell wall biosynthesis